MKASPLFTTGGALAGGTLLLAVRQKKARALKGTLIMHMPSVFARRLRVLFFPLILSSLTAFGSIDFQNKGPDLLQSAGPWTADRGQAEGSKDGWKLTGPSAGSSNFKLTIPAEPGAEYFFAADTNSVDRVVYFLGGLSMSYHHQGDWQTVCGLVRTNENKTLELRVQLRSLESGREAAAEIKNLVLQKVIRPEKAESLPRSGATALVAAGRPAAVIVYPSQGGRALGEKVRDAVREKTGVELPLVADTDVTEKDYPVLLPEFREKNLIVLGRLATNRALWSAYNRYLTAEDGYYPGGDGFVVRTAANVFGNGKNHLVLGGSSDAGVARAVAKFGEIVAALGKEKSLPWTLEVELGGECLKAFQADNAQWQDPTNPALPAMTSGYGKVVRWYQNAMGYYWSGWPEYLERSRGYLKEILAERAHTHQYIIEFFIRTYGMLDASPIFTPEESARLDSLVLQNFFDFLTVTDLGWMSVFSPPYSEVGASNRHQIAPWYADLLMARFLQRHVGLSGGLKELVDFRLSEKDAMFRYIAANRNGPSLPGMAGASDYDEFPAMFFRYALENDQYKEFFASGLAHQTLALERFNHASGRFASPACAADMPIQLGAMAHLTRDGRYQWLDEKVAFTGLERGPFQGRYVAKVHRYQAGDEIAPKEPDLSWAGIQVAPQPERTDQTEERNRTRFPLLSMRGGFGPEDDYLAVTGFNSAMPSGSLLSLDINRLSVFGTSEAGNGGGSSRSTTNGASVVRLNGFQISQKNIQEGESPCELRWKAQLPDFWAFEVETQISPDMNWTRDVIRLANGEYVFRDTFTARRAGKYLLQVGWQPSSSVTKTGDGWVMVTNRGSVRIDQTGAGFSQRKTGNSLAWESVRTMEPGDSATVWTTVQALKGGVAPWVAVPQSETQIRLTNASAKRQVTLHQGSLATAAGDLAASLVLADGKGVGIFGWRETPDALPKSFFLERDSREIQPASQPAPLSAKTWVSSIEEALNKPAAASKQAAEKAEDKTVIADESARWKTDWTYDGLLRPVPVPTKSPVPGIFDFGKLRELVEIRSDVTGRLWHAGYVPKEIFVAPEAAVQAPAADSPDWIRLEGRRVSRPGIKTGNYGEATPVDHADESLFLTGIKTRFVRTSEEVNLKFFASDELASRHPVRLDVLRDLPGAPSPLLMARSDIFAAFPRKMRHDDFSLALLDPKAGKPRAQIDVAGPVQSVLVADQKGRGEAEIFVLSGAVKIDVFSLEGKAREPIDLYAQFVEFQKKYGRENTRAPAGGHYLPFSLGLWRPNANGASKFVISRYGSLAFLDENRRLEGLLMFPSYASPGMLPHGYDFDGDGQEEMLVLEHFNLVHVGGDAKARVRDGGGWQFWPQVYDRLAVEPAVATSSTLLSGAPIYSFEVLERFGGKPRFAFVARGDYVGLYDAVDRKWTMNWGPPAPISSAAVVKETAERFELCLATVDGLFWSVTWDARRPGRPAIAVAPLPLSVRQIQSGVGRDGTAVLAAEEGLFLRAADGTISRIANGAFDKAVFVSPTQIAASNQRGQVLSFSPR